MASTVGVLIFRLKDGRNNKFIIVVKFVIPYGLKFGARKFYLAHLLVACLPARRIDSLVECRADL